MAKTTKPSKPIDWENLTPEQNQRLLSLVSPNKGKTPPKQATEPKPLLKIKFTPKQPSKLSVAAKIAGDVMLVGACVATAIVAIKGARNGKA